MRKTIGIALSCFALGVFANSIDISSSGPYKNAGPFIGKDTPQEEIKEAQRVAESAPLEQHTAVRSNLFGLRIPLLYIMTLDFPDGKEVTGLFLRSNFDVLALDGLYKHKSGHLGTWTYEKAE